MAPVSAIEVDAPTAQARPVAIAQSLERQLGDPHDPSRAFSYAGALACDRREAFPAVACGALEQWGIERYYVPAGHGGSLSHYDEILHVMRVVARRDLTVAIGHGKTYLGGVCVWMGGAAAQARALGRRILDGAVVSLALTERNHGSDLLAGDLCAQPCPRGLQLSGEKWLINNATRGDLLCVLARTSSDGGPRGYSMVLVDKHELEPGCFTPLPKVPTHGIRGADISGIAFHRATVAGEAIVGEAGFGIEILLRSLQVTRTMCASLSLGAADTAVRLATRFALARNLYGRPLIELPSVRRTLAEAYGELLVSEVVATIAARSLDVFPAQASISSAVAKYLVPSFADRLIGRVGQILGARGVLEDVYVHGLFQKLERDQRIVGLFDGNTLVNLQTIVNQGPSLARALARHSDADAPLGELFGLDAARRQLDPAALALVARGGCAVVQSLASLLQRLDGAAAADPALVDALAFGRRLAAASAQVHSDLSAPAGPVDKIPAAAFGLAERYALCFAGASVLGVWLHNRSAYEPGETSGLWSGARWLTGALATLVARLDGPNKTTARATDALIEPLVHQTRAAHLYSLFGLELSEEGTC